MGKLSGTRVYLAGPMDRVKDGGKTWRRNITPTLVDMGIVVIDPCNKPIDMGIEDSSARAEINQLKQEGRYGEIRSKFSAVRTVDLRCVDISDFIIVYINIDIHLCGTFEELFTANRQKKPVLIFCEQGKKNIPNWLFFTLPSKHMFNNIEELINYLEMIDNNKIQDESRWVFFDKQKLAYINV